MGSSQIRTSSCNLNKASVEVTETDNF